MDSLQLMLEAPDPGRLLDGTGELAAPPRSTPLSGDEDDFGLLDIKMDWLVERIALCC